MKTSHLAAGAALIIAVFVFWPEAETVDPAEFSQKNKNKTPYFKSKIGRAEEESFLTYRDGEYTIQQAGAPTKKALKRHYKLYFRYPKQSRPLDRNNKDLLEPFAFESLPMPLVPASATGPEDIKETGYRISYSTGNQSVIGSQPFYSTVKVFERESQHLVPIEVVSVQVLGDIRSGRLPVSAAGFSDAGVQGDRIADDNITTFRFVNQSGQAAWGELLMRIDFRVEGDDEVYRFEVPFFYTPQEPARFTGNFREVLQNGDLMVFAEVEILKKGYYTFEANLYHEEGEPTHWVYHKEELEEGLFEIPFTFFGLIFHEKNKAGKFALGELRGYRHNIPFSTKNMEKMLAGGAGAPPNLKTKDEPDREMMAPFADKYETSQYQLEQFGNEVYDGEDKKQKLNELDALPN